MASKKQKTSFQALIEGDTPVLLDFHASWCGPCHAFAPVLEQLKKEVGDRVKIVKIDVDQNQALSQKLGVQSIPTVMIYRNGQLQWRATGGQSIGVLKKELGVV